MLALNAISYSVAGKTILKNISLNLTQKKYGLVGPNGVGKTTLAKIISGEIQPTEGHITKNGTPIYFAQNAERPAITLGEFLAEIWQHNDTHAELKANLLKDLDFARHTNELSGGEWIKARFVKTISAPSTFLILDEPSNNLDRASKEIILDFLKSYTGGILLISHDRELLEMTDAIFELSNQGISAYGGAFSFYWEARQKEREQQAEHLFQLKHAANKSARERQMKLQRQEKRMRTGQKKADKGGLPRILVGGLKRKAQKSLGKLVRQEKEIVTDSQKQANEAWLAAKSDPFLKLDFSGTQVPAGKKLLIAEQLNWRFAQNDKELWPTPIDFMIQGQERWQIRGGNGTGKSTLLKLIAKALTGHLGTQSGKLQINAKTVAYLDQNYSLLPKNKALLEHLQENLGRNAVELRNELALYGFIGESVFQKISTLSGGELLKASLAQIFLTQSPPDLLLLDEPTNNLDLNSIALLEEALKKFSGTLLVVSHDMHFTDKIDMTHSLELDVND